MNALLLLMGLLVLSYIGSFLVSGRAVRGVGLPSGVEYVTIGFILGPGALGIFERSMLASFEPLAQAALGWLALVIGIDFGFAGDRRVRWRGLLFGALGAIVTGGFIMAAVYFSLQRLHVVASRRDALLLAGGLAVACAETTRHAVRWVVERHRAEGKLSELLNELAHVDDGLSIFGLAVLFAVTQREVHLAHVAAPVTVWAWIGATITVGLVLGAVAALLIGSEFHLHTTWGVLFGTSLLAIGLAGRLGIASLAVTFFMGVGMALVSPHHKELRETVAPTERPVLLPALVLAGARVDLTVLTSSYRVALVVAAVLLARIAGKLVSGMMLRVARAARSASPLIGLGLLSSGALSVSVGLALAIRFPGVVGDTVLLTAAISAILGEFVGPPTLRRALAQAGEIVEAPAPASEASAPAEEAQ